MMHNTNAHPPLASARPQHIAVICVSLGLPGWHLSSFQYFTVFSGFYSCLGVRYKHTYLLIQSHAQDCHSEPAGCQGGAFWKPGWDVDISKHPKTPVSSPGGPGNLEKSCTAVLHGRRGKMGLQGWCVLGGAKCMVPNFSCMSPNPQLHTPVPLQHQAISSSLGNAGFAWRRQEETPV